MTPWLRCALGFLQGKVLLSFATGPLRREVTAQPPPKEWAVLLHLLEGGVSTEIIWNSAQDVYLLSPILFINSVIYLHQNGLLDMYFILWVIIPILLYFVAQIVPARTVQLFQLVQEPMLDRLL